MISLATKLGFVAFIIGFASAQPLLNHPEWLNFKSTHGKTYNNEYEEIMRHAIFFTNLKKIEEHNALFEKGLKTYSMRMNQYGDFTPKEFAESLKGLARRDLSAEHHQTQNDLLSSSPLPDSVDWRKKGAVTPVKNQGQCGSCWSFSATGALEGQLFIHNATLVSLSEQNLVDCAGSEGNYGCSGGWPDWAFNYVSKAGIDTEESYPYQANDATCRFNKEHAILAGVKSVMIPQNEKALQNAVANIGPISICIDAGNDSFMFYGRGLYYEPQCSTQNLDHAVLIVGYGSENGEDYWTVKNSWDTTWGEEGYIRMARNKNNNCGVVSHATYPIIA